MTNHVILAAGLIAHLLLLYALFRRNHAAELPSFTALVIFYLLRSAGLVAAQGVTGHTVLVPTTLLLDLIDVLLQGAVLAELTWIALKPLPGKRRLTLPLLLLASGVLITLRIAPHSRFSLPALLVLAHFLISILMVEWAVMLLSFLRPLRRSWRSPVAAITFGFGVYSVALLAGGGYFTAGRPMRDYIFFSFFRIGVYLVVVLLWALSVWLAKPETTG